MSNPSPSSNGKGSARRREDQSKIRENWDSIDWSKGRPAAKPVEPSVEEVLLADYAAKPKCSCGQPGEEDHTCPYAEEINGSDALCNCCSDCQYECCMAI